MGEAWAFPEYNDRSKNIWGISTNFILKYNPMAGKSWVIRTVFRSVYEDQHGKDGLVRRIWELPLWEQDTLEVVVAKRLHLRV